jgi:hypothetical protein
VHCRVSIGNVKIKDAGVVKMVLKDGRHMPSVWRNLVSIRLVNFMPMSMSTKWTRTS